ncbi:MAG TPA: alpha/beta hydrolase domain-containing protein [Solirubrobacteraceae bacterium]|nr:alpha/beta hydrolase domain-containing protein [Solirubrobacteraceae bacterium]
MASGGRAALALAAALIGALTLAATAAAATPVPRVEGPLPATEASHPFGGAAWQLRPQDLAEHGYVEEEYLVSGAANVYTWSGNEAVVRTAGAPYTTRMLVRRPIKPAKLSGTAVVEPLNPSNQFDLNIGWALAGDQIMRNGDVWVGFTSKPVAAQALRNFDGERYADLSWANPLPLDDPANCTNVITLVDRPEFRSRATEDGLVWDVLSQVGAWVRSDAASSPLLRKRGPRPASAIDRVYAFGYSQTGSMLITYLNAIQPRVVAEAGAPVFDGFFVGVAGGAFIGAAPLNQCTPVPPLGDPRRSLRDAGVPVIQMMSQSDYRSGIASRGPDGNTPPDLYRHYEMAGAAHATPDELYYSARTEDIVAAGRAVPPMACNEGPRSRFPSRIFVDAALRNLDLWSRQGIPAPPGADILVQAGQPVLDAFGNVVGGLRSPYLDVPTSTWTGSSTGDSFCFIAGHEIPFEQARLDALYPTRGSYVGAVARNVRALVAQRYLTPEDGRELIREAAHTDIRELGE